MKWLRITIMLLGICAGLIIYVQREFPELLLKGEIIEREHVLIYVPRFHETQPHPLLITLSPVADARTMVRVWAAAADEFGWLIVSSKDFRNGIDPVPAFETVLAAVQNLGTTVPLDRNRIVAAGMSGGAMGSYMMAHDYPDTIAGVILNTGMMYQEYQKHPQTFPRGKLAAFQASPTDFRFDQMKEDERFLRSRGWTTWWKEFSGGHVLAPVSLNRDALQWMDEQLRSHAAAAKRNVSPIFGD